MNIGVVLDTNALFISTFKDFKELNFIKRLEHVLNTIEVNGAFSGKVELLVPKIVLNELVQQQSKSYYRKINDLLEYKFHSFEIIKDTNYDNYLRDLFNAYLQSYKFNTEIKVLSYPDIPIEKLINRAIKQYPPFLGKDKETDKGFKDVILWENILEYKRLFPEQTLILFSGDKIFESDYLFKEYRDLFGEELVIVDNEIALVDILGEKLNTNVIQTESNIIFNKFKTVIARSNLSELYKGITYHHPLNSGSYMFRRLKILTLNGLFNEISIHVVNGVEVRYFVIEIGLELIFSESYVHLDNSPTINITDFYEFEIYYYPEGDYFKIFGFESPFDEESVSYSQDFILRQEINNLEPIVDYTSE
ncbi:hypothetical protein DUZ99_09995 [Xylanibacillus composti]|uniref:DUF4935 domain-containing protein n=1 Tax=Xylanibacillus composti TaxID=1572762 RepID=A0A8J4M3W4_9BACL|nr:PIN domain-containing protein [Xylanibacillus composti]MDT9725302.1 hypothetical protein [Xylanibacillus composti]GIQ70505.1 hypothetical protein XYCOK13_33290 [Xylanibacillus composti]